MDVMTTPDDRVTKLLDDIDAMGKVATDAGLTAEQAVKLAAGLIYRGVGILLASRMTTQQCAGITRSMIDTLLEIRGKTH